MIATFFNRMPMAGQQHFIRVCMRAGQSRLHIARCLGTDLDGLKGIEAWVPDCETETHQPETKTHQPATNGHQAETIAAKPEPKFVKVRIPVIHSKPCAPLTAQDEQVKKEPDKEDSAGEIDEIEDDDDEMPAGKGRPHGWLITESEMNEIYAPFGGAQAYKGR